MTPPKPLPTQGMESEGDFQTWVKDVAKITGWMVYHTHDSRRSDEGFPDLVLLRGERWIVAELKAEGKNPTPAQMIWLEAFRVAGRHPSGESGLTPEVYVWRTQDREEIMAILGLKEA